jgi:hypothetical protein
LFKAIERVSEKAMNMGEVCPMAVCRIGRADIACELSRDVAPIKTGIEKRSAGIVVWNGMWKCVCPCIESFESLCTLGFKMDGVVDDSIRQVIPVGDDDRSVYELIGGNRSW